MKTTLFVLTIWLFSSLLFSQIQAPPQIDGEIDTVWSEAAGFYPETLVKNFLGVPLESDTDFSGSFRTLWDTTAFYVLVEINDDQLNSIGELTSHNDNTEIYFDLDNSKLSEYDGVDDEQIRIEYNFADVYTSKRNAEGIQFAQTVTETGWRVEAAFPWQSLTDAVFVPRAGTDIGFDLMITDNDGNEKKDYVLAWNSPDNDAWKDPGKFGVMRLLESGTTDSIYYDPTPPDHDGLPIDETHVSCFLYVNQKHPEANDGNDGNDPDQPLLTIAQALALAEAQLGAATATKIIIEPGVYREGGLTVVRRGSPYSFMNSELVIEGSHPDSVIISGSDVWADGWTEQGEGVWRHDWPYAMVPKDAWGRLNALGQRREVIFINGQWMRQVIDQTDLADNTFYVADNDGIYVKVPETLDFENALKEVSMRGDGVDAPWPPSGLFRIPAEKDKVVLRNLTFTHANNRMQAAGAVQIRGWNVLLENCRILWNNGIGLNLNEMENFVIRNCSIDHNGGSGIDPGHVANGLIENTSTSRNNWRGDLGGLNSWALGGIKFHYAHNVVVKNHTAEFNLCPGLWTDLDISGFVFENCTVNNNWGPGLLIEISQDIQIKDCDIHHNATGIRVHSSHDVSVDGNTFTGNAIHISTYNDHRDFSSVEWQNNLGFVWDKTPSNWSLTNNTFIAEDNPVWQDSVEMRIPSWMRYSNPGYQPFFHFSADQAYLDFFATASVEGNTWTHPATDTPFMDMDENPLTVDAWRVYVASLRTTNTDNGRQPLNFYQLQNYPNPFNPVTSIVYALPAAEKVSLRIFNVAGKEIRILVNEKIPAGRHEVKWDGLDQSGCRVASGIYFYQIKTPNFKKVKKCMLVK